MILRQMADLAPRRLKWLLRTLWQQPLETLPDCPESFRFFRAWANHREIRRVPGGWVYRGQTYPDYLTAGGASCAIFRTALRLCSGRGVDVGAGHWPLPGAVPVDPFRGPGTRQTLDQVADGSLDYVFSSHCLEHVREWERELARWAGKIRPGGVIFLYLPHPACGIWRPGSPFVGDGHVWVPTLEALRTTLVRLSFVERESDAGPDAMWSFFVCAEKTGASPAVASPSGG